MSDAIEASTSSSSSPRESVFIHPRREPFEHGLLPIPKLIFTDPNATLAPLRDKLVAAAADHPTRRVDSKALSDALQISLDHARLVVDTLTSVLHDDADPLVRAKSSEIDAVGADVYDLILFLYIQSYKRLLPRTHKDSAAVADVWPSTSAFDGYLSALSPLQVYCFDHLLVDPKTLISLSAATAGEPVEGEGEESLVCTATACFI
ncbi:hypothetical protein CK203_077194 [Vitis vinifera]|uniref:Uncharacterized protein n=1 Tax=Vitis vinifera TaxID=29760 RepID=A0A438D5R5_VITVI|nr:hypothetical protein CK203_077194 [Vitis vinifera]